MDNTYVIIVFRYWPIGNYLLWREIVCLEVGKKSLTLSASRHIPDNRAGKECQGVHHHLFQLRQVLRSGNLRRLEISRPAKRQEDINSKRGPEISIVDCSYIGWILKHKYVTWNSTTSSTEEKGSCKLYIVHTALQKTGRHVRSYQPHCHSSLIT